MKAFRTLHVAVALVIAVVVWLAGTAGAFLFAWRLNAAETQHLGAAGDIFGASSALFGALSFVGLLVVLFVEIKDRQRDLSDREEELRPVLVPEIDPLGVQVMKAARTGEQLQVTLVLKLSVLNLTPEPALNVGIECKGQTGIEFEITMSDFPFKASESRGAVVYMNIFGARAAAVLEQLASGSELEIGITILHHSLRAVSWTSNVAFVIKCDESNSQGRLRAAVRNEDSIEGTQGAVGNQNDIYLKVTPVAGSWNHARTDV